MLKNILIVEDSKYKKDLISKFLMDFDKTINLTHSASFTSGWNRISTESFDLIIMDMSLPTYDESDKESGGSTRTFGGRELSRKMLRKRIKTPIIFITQYGAFSSETQSTSISELNKELQKDLKNQEENIIFFDPSSHGWKESLKEVIKSI